MKAQALSVSTATSETVGQVSIILSILETLWKSVCSPENFQRDEESTVASSATWIKACDRLDTILDQSDRWAPPPPGDHTKQVMDAVAIAQIRSNEAQTMLAYTLARPSSRFRPQLEKQRDGTWKAYYDKNTRNSIVGHGTTPDEALEDFDVQIMGPPPTAEEEREQQ